MGRMFRPPSAKDGFEGPKATLKTADGSGWVEREAKRERVGRAERKPPSNRIATKGEDLAALPLSIGVAPPAVFRCRGAARDVARSRRVHAGGRCRALDCAVGGMWRIATHGEPWDSRWTNGADRPMTAGRRILLAFWCRRGRRSSSVAPRLGRRFA